MTAGCAKNAAVPLTERGNGIMMNESIIKSKYKEYYEKYSRQNIDDYENYVISRTIEYFYNTERFSVDKLVDFVTFSIKETDPGAQYEPEPDKGPDNMRTDGVKNSSRSKANLKKAKRMHRGGHDKKLWPLILIFALIIGGCVGYLLGWKK